jgi:GntR family transcriptional repressor for pyruvate dehydrogenase complex
MSLSALRHGSLSDDVAERVLAVISSGEFSAGDRLPTEPVLAQMLGVGRTSVREGIAKLRMLGAVEVRRGLGTFVTGRGAADPQFAFLQWAAEHRYRIVDLFEVRTALETTAASLGSQRATDAELDNLEAAANAHVSAHEAGDLADLVDSDQDFHLALVRCSHNEALLHVYEILVPQFRDYRGKSLALEGAAHRSGEDHLAVVAAVRAHDSEAASRAVSKHLATLYEEIVAAGSSADAGADAGRPHKPAG